MKILVLPIITLITASNFIPVFAMDSNQEEEKKRLMATQGVLINTVIQAGRIIASEVDQASRATPQTHGNNVPTVMCTGEKASTEEVSVGAKLYLTERLMEPSLGNTADTFGLLISPEERAMADAYLEQHPTIKEEEPQG